MAPNPFLGVIFHWLGGLAAGSFYVPFRAVRRWSWETYWLAGGVFSWIVAPWLLALLMTRDLLPVLRAAPASSLAWAYLFGVLWGIGGLMFGLAVRYLGVSLGVAVALGYCAAFGTIMPPLFRGELFTKVLPSASGQVVLLGVLVCLAGIAIAGWAGTRKEHELTQEQKKLSVEEFDFRRGLLVATVAGVMSACFAYGLAAADPIKAISLKHGTPTLWQGLPALVVVLLGGFTTNFVWCAALSLRNRTFAEYWRPFAGPSDRSGEGAAATGKGLPAPLLANYLLCILAGVTWYLQFFFYTMGETQMGSYRFSSWTLHMASIILFSSLWGIALREWRGTSRGTRALLALGMAVLIGSTLVVGYGNYLGVKAG